MNFPKTGNASFFIHPRSDGVPANYQLYDKRGDIGVITLEPGPIIKGRVVDTDGKPLAGIYVRAMGPYTRPPESGQISGQGTRWFWHCRVDPRHQLRPVQTNNHWYG